MNDEIHVIEPKDEQGITPEIIRPAVKTKTKKSYLHIWIPLGAIFGVLLALVLVGLNAAAIIGLGIGGALGGVLLDAELNK